MTKAEVYMLGWNDGVAGKVRRYPAAWSIYDTSIYQSGRVKGLAVKDDAVRVAASVKGLVGQP